MLDFLGETKGAEMIMEAITGILVEGKTLTPDLGGSARTAEIGEAIGNKIYDLGA